MAQPGENIWTPRFLILVGLVLAGQIILGIIIYIFSGYSNARTELALTAYLLLCGVSILGLLLEPTPRKIILGGGFFVLIALFALIAIPGLQGGINGRQPGNSPQQFLSSVVFVLALLAFLGKVVTRKGEAEDMLFPTTSWFIRLSHLALAGIAGLELLLQLAFGNRLLLLPFASRLYDGFTLNSAAALLLGALLVFSLLRFNSLLTRFDGWMVLILSFACFLLQYTFGSTELAHLYPGTSPSLAVGINLGLAVVSLTLAIIALFSEWGRFLATLWLAIQILILQLFLGQFARTGAGGTSQPVAVGQFILYVLAIALIMLALRLLLYWDRRQLNVIDGIAVAAITLVVGLTMWSLGQSYFQQGQSFLTPQQGINLLSLSYGLTAIAYLIGIAAIIAVVLICVRLLFRRHRLWLERVESVVGTILVLGITSGTLLMLNTLGKQSDYLAAAMLTGLLGANPLPLSISNQYILDGLFVLMLLIYVSALVTQRWDRTFAHTERALVLLSGGACLIILASPGRLPVLPLVSSTVQQIVAYGQPVFTAEHIATTGILIAALVSLLWLMRSRNMTERIVLAAIFGVAAICTLVYYFAALPALLLISLILLTAGTLIAIRIEHVQTDHGPQPAEQTSDEPADSPAT